MKLRIICKEDNLSVKDDESIVVNCGICIGIDTLTSVKVVIEEYSDEIEEIVYPECEILKRALSKIR